MKVEIPSTYDLIDAAAEVVFNRDGFLGLELIDFGRLILPAFERWIQFSETGLNPDTVEQTVVGPAPVPESSASALSEPVDPAPASPPTESRPRRRPVAITADLTPEVPSPRRRRPLTDDLSMFETTMPIPTPDDESDIPADLEPPRADALTVEAPTPVGLHEALVPNARTQTPSDGASDLPTDHSEEQQGNVAAAGTDALQDRELRLHRATPGGVLTVTDPIDLLGLYLSQVRHGTLTVWGGPRGGLGERVRIKVRGLQVIDLAGLVMARVGDWLTLSIDNPDALRALVADAHESWAPTTAELQPAGRSEPSEVEPFADASGAQLVDSSEQDSSSCRPDPAAPAPAKAATKPGKKPATGIPVPPHLDGDLVVFEKKDDLKREMDANLRNGGLFVIADPIKIRSKRRLRVKVGADVLPVTLETDVVFADGGRVGFSIANTPAAQKDLRRYLRGELPLDSPARPTEEAQPQTGGLQTTDVASLNEDAVRSSDVQTFAGKLTRPPGNSELIHLQDARVEDPAELGAVSMLRLFEYIIRQRWKGVLTVQNTGQLHRIWTHEGSVAFIESEPFEESTGLGRLLVSQKKVSEAQLREALDKSRQT
ncbi:MAG: DUF4388 domain-containing protein, partial [Myxococcota bacterium]